MDAQPLPPGPTKPMTHGDNGNGSNGSKKLKPVMERDVYYVYHYEGTRRACVRDLATAMELAEGDRDDSEFGRHCVVRNRRIVYWSRRTNNTDRRIVRHDFHDEGIIVDFADALEAKDDLQDQQPQASDGKGLGLEEEAVELLEGLESRSVVSFRVITPKGSEVITVIRETELSMFSHAIAGGDKVFADSQVAALKGALKRFRRRVRVDHIESESRS